MGIITLLDDTRITRAAFDRRISRAKNAMKQNFIDDKGYLYCVECGKNSSGCPGIAASHLVSTPECVELYFSDMAYDLDNIEPMGQKCHRKFENTPLKIRYNRFKNKKL